MRACEPPIGFFLFANRGAGELLGGVSINACFYATFRQAARSVTTVSKVCLAACQVRGWNRKLGAVSIGFEPGIAMLYRDRRRAVGTYRLRFLEKT
jgi:hypothetical protein